MFKEELIIIRHARSMHNIRSSENLDDTISEFGERQARNVGNFLGEAVNLQGFQLLTSPFLRCLKTADLIAVRAGLTEPMVVPKLREYLNHSGKSAFVINRKEEFHKMNWSAYPTEGELFTEEFNEVFLHRMHDAYSALPDRSIVVTHGLPALTLMRVAIEPNIRSVPVWDHSIDNCSITIIRRGRLIWHGRNLYHEHDYDPKLYRRDWDGVVKKEHS